MPEKTSNKRVKDEVHEHENAQWGFSDNMSSFVGKVQERFPNIRITSGKRESEHHHNTGDAVDIGVRRENDKEALAMYEWLMNDQEGLSLLVSHGLGVIDETNPETMDKTEASGPHFHIGPDAKYTAKPKERLGQFDNYYVYPDREGVKYKREGDKWLVNLGKETQGQYKPINDPTGSRAKELESKAVLIPVKPTWESSYYASHLDHDYSKPYTSTGGQTPLEAPTDSPIPFELVRGTPQYEFLKDIKDIKTKQDIQTEKQKESEARKNIIAKQKAEDEQRQLLIDAISQNKVSERPQEQPSRNQMREPRQQEIELQSQTQLPSLPSLLQMPQFEQGENPKFQDGGELIVDSQGQYNHPGKNTRVPSNKITMKGINYPVYGVPNIGEPVMMQPDQEYTFEGAEYVDEYPMMDGFHMMPDGTMMRDDQMPEYQNGGTPNQQAYDDSLSLYNQSEYMKSFFKDTGEKYPRVDSWKGYNPDKYPKVISKNIKAESESPFLFGSDKNPGYIKNFKKPVGGPGINTKLQGTIDPKMSVAVNLRKRGMDSSFEARKRLAEEAGIENYKGDAKQNIELNDYVFSNYEGKDKIQAQQPDEKPLVKAQSTETRQPQQPIEQTQTQLQEQKQGEIVLPDSTLEWKQTPSGTWYQVQRAKTGTTGYNLATGSIKQLENGGKFQGSRYSGLFRR